MPIKKALLGGLTAAGLVLGLSLSAQAAPAIPKGPATPAYKTMPPLVEVDRKRRNRGYYSHKGNPYYNGHRGYRKHRRGYRRYNGFWFPPAAFAFGFGVAPVPRYVAPPVYVAPRRYNAPVYGRGLSPAHYQWCGGRYRSYRAYDNTFQPYHGPRRACFSPYGP